METRTERLRLVAGSLDIAIAEIERSSRFGEILRADVPPDWPPETVRDALPFFLGLYRAHPDWVGWLGWYAISFIAKRPVLCGSVGFKGPPTDEGIVEIGYSLLPDHRGLGIATEMVEGLVAWAAAQDGVRAVEAETMPDNRASIRVLERSGFVPAGAGVEPGSLRFARMLAIPLT